MKYILKPFLAFIAMSTRFAAGEMRYAPEWKGAGVFDADFKGVEFGPGLLGNAMQLHLMNDKVANGAVCMDGTPAGFYYTPAANPNNTNDWQIYFEGGGWCYDAMGCYGRSFSALGSSAQWPSTMKVKGIMSDNCTVNPDFCNFNRVYLAYCDGNSFTGNRDEPLVVKGKPLYFRGRRIIDAVLESLLPLGITNANKVFLTGCSAGGLSTYIHVDIVHKWLQTNAPSMNVFKSAALSGFFLDHKNLIGVPAYESQIRSIFEIANSTFGVNDACIAAYPADEQWKCNFAQYTYPHIKAPFFAVNSAYDLFQIECIYAGQVAPGFPNQNGTANDNCNSISPWQNCVEHPNDCNSTQMVTMNKYIADFKADMFPESSYNKNGNGAFIHSCHTHCEAQDDEEFMGFRINGTSIQEAVGAWWHQPLSTPAYLNHYDPCSYNTGEVSDRSCNPTCLHPKP